LLRAEGDTFFIGADARETRAKQRIPDGAVLHGDGNEAEVPDRRSPEQVLATVVDQIFTIDGTARRHCSKQ
jgi:hypothetical protein